MQATNLVNDFYRGKRISKEGVTIYMLLSPGKTRTERQAGREQAKASRTPEGRGWAGRHYKRSLRPKKISV